MYRYTVRACASTGGKSVLSDYERAPMPVVCLDIQTEMNIQPEGGEEQVMVSIQNNAEKSIILGDAMSVNPDTGASTFFDAYSSENVKADTIEVLGQTNQRIIYKAEEASGMTKDSEYILYIYMMYDGEEYASLYFTRWLLYYRRKCSMNGLLSVIIPAYKEEEMISRTAETISGGSGAGGYLI